MVPFVKLTRFVKPAFLAASPLAALLMACTAPAAHAQTYSTNVGGAIPDNNVTGVSSVITLTNNLSITTFNSITITGLTHTYVGDLIITLTHGATTVDILDRAQGNGDTATGDNANLNGTYTFVASGGRNFNTVAASAFNNDTIGSGTYNTLPVGGAGGSGGVSFANGSLTDFAGANTSGDWILRISDRKAADTGSFTGFSFNVTTASAAPTAVPEPGEWAIMGMLGTSVCGLMVRARRKAGNDIGKKAVATA